MGRFENDVYKRRLKYYQKERKIETPKVEKELGYEAFRAVLSKQNSRNNVYEDSVQNWSRLHKSFDFSKRSLITEDIQGASPKCLRKLTRKKIFIDRNEVKSIFGQNIGKYHGYVNDLKSGGTYNQETHNKELIDDITNDIFNLNIGKLNGSILPKSQIKLTNNTNNNPKNQLCMPRLKVEHNSKVNSSSYLPNQESGFCSLQLNGSMTPSREQLAGNNLINNSKSASTQEMNKKISLSNSICNINQSERYNLNGCKSPYFTSNIFNRELQEGQNNFRASSIGHQSSSRIINFNNKSIDTIIKKRLRGSLDLYAL